MESYGDLTGESGVAEYEIEEDYLKVRFKGNPTIYIYTTSKVGKHHIEVMKALAIEGQGLSSYISQHPKVKNNYIKE